MKNAKNMGPKPVRIILDQKNKNRKIGQKCFYQNLMG